ncbi:TIGR03086 family metal-binding protein [Nonomuraea sp. NPDC050536]|uniref:TIGR03086 family metal-binding protein n=1 Tax=Nonomuraea sp. NPDC050536 TaxID=3364366 RepID=UPI0037C75911
MTGDPAAAALAGGVALLERAIGYTLGSLNLVTSEALTRPTPCAGWDLATLLDHMDDSLAALSESAIPGHVSLTPPAPPDAGPAPATLQVVPAVVGSLRTRACGLLGAWAAAQQGHAVSIGDCSLDAVIVASVGAIEVAVHGWDIARACGQLRPIPPRIAEELLDLAPLFITSADRPHRFASPPPLPPHPTPSDHLLTYLGRTPH